MAETKREDKPAERKDLRIYDDRFRPEESTLGRWDAKVEMGTTRADLLKPEYWSHVAERITPWSEITVRAEDGTFYAKYLVLDCGRGWAKLQELNWWNLTTKDVAQTQSSAGQIDDYALEYKGTTRKWIVLRKVDQTVLDEGKPSKEAARLWLEEFLTAKARTTESA